MHFNDTLASLPIARAEDHKCTRMKVDVVVRLFLEARQRVEEENAWTEAEEEARLVEEARLKAEEEDQALRKGVPLRHSS